MGVRRQAREAALQGIFRSDFLDDWDADAIRDCLQNFSIAEAVTPFAVKLCEGVIEHSMQIDSKITCASENWSLSRMARVDRCILRLATFEIAFFDEVPVNVAINEAIEIAKRFGSDESPTFINGVLDKVASTYRGELSKSIEVIREAPATSSTDEILSPDDLLLDQSAEDTPLN